jgi:hypothetical protein
MTDDKTFLGGIAKSATAVVDKYAGVETRKQIEKGVETLAASMYIDACWLHYSGLTYPMFQLARSCSRNSQNRVELYLHIMYSLAINVGLGFHEIVNGREQKTVCIHPFIFWLPAPPWSSLGTRRVVIQGDEQSMREIRTGSLCLMLSLRISVNLNRIRE